MLNELLRLLEQNQGELDLLTISRELHAQTSAVAGMIETLVRKGRLVEIRPDCGVCSICSAKNQCILPSKTVKRYAVMDRSVFSDRIS